MAVFKSIGFPFRFQRIFNTKTLHDQLSLVSQTACFEQRSTAMS